MSARFASKVAVLFAACASDAVSVTPVEKVTQLLENLAVKVEKEGKAEAAAYDKYACFCKEQMDNKQYAIERSTDKITSLSAQIQKLGTEITELDGEISGLNTKIQNLGTEITNNQKTRDSEHDAFLVVQADVDSAISAVERAIQAMKESRMELAGNAERFALAQVKTTARKVMSRSDVEALRLGEPGDAYTYKYQSNDIIATLQNLLGIFRGKKTDIEQTEFDANSAHEMRQQDLANQKKFAEKEMREKEAVREAKSEKKEAKEADKTQESAEMGADKNFLGVLQTDCQEKARLWDQRSQTRSEELTAISDAISALKNGVAPNWKANKKLVGIQKAGSVRSHAVYVEESQSKKFVAASPVSLFQLRSSNLRGARPGVQLADRVHQLLATSALQLRSPVLSMAALKVRAAEDHFVKVRQIIKDLIARLKADATAEAQQKTFCDEQMENAVDERDAQEAKSEDLGAQITGNEAEQDQLKRDIAELSKQIAQNKKALLEATELRNEESAENAKTIEEAVAGRDAVQKAIDFLKTFYEGHSVLAQFVPTDSDREGLTVTDRAPEVFDSEYKGSQEASKGIIGMLEVILSDFDRTDSNVNTAETDAAQKYSTFKSENEQDTLAKEGAVNTKDGRITTLEGELVTLQDKKADADKAHSLAIAELDKLHATCVAGEESYEDRVAQRNKEIEALKEAHAILEDWQK